MFIFIRLWSYMVWNYGGHNKKVKVARDAKEHLQLHECMNSINVH